jgi:hypothetical protein
MDEYTPERPRVHESMDTPVYIQEQVDTIVAEALRRQRATAHAWQERYDQVKHWHQDLIEHQNTLRLMFEALESAREANKHIVASFEDMRHQLDDQLAAVRQWSLLSGTPMTLLPWLPLEAEDDASEAEDE